MSAICDALVAIGMTFGGFCDADKPVDTNLPSDDPSAYMYKAALPPEPEPEPLPVAMPPFPPIIIKERVEIKPAPAPKVVYRDIPRPDPIELALISALGFRHGQSTDLVESTVLSLSTDPTGLIAPPASITPPQIKASPAPDYEAEGRISGLPVDNSRILTADRYISGILETGINSQLDSEDGGTAIIQVSRDVFGYHDRNILIPRGSRMICDYDSPKKAGSTRISLQCNRILLGETRVEIYQLASTVGDAQGHAGITGDVDNRWWEKYGSAIVLSAISATIQGAASLATNSGGGGGATTASGGDSASAAQEAAANLSERFGEISASVLEKTVNLAPVITISQGTRIQIRPRFDWYIKEPTQALPPANS